MKMRFMSIIIITVDINSQLADFPISHIWHMDSSAVGPSHILKAHLIFLKEHENCPNLYYLHATMSLPVYELLR